jgi:Sulfotransferase domain
MKKIHYINIGYPKTGTTWLYNNLLEHEQIDHDYIKENDFLVLPFQTLTDYTLPYETKTISLNFSNTQWRMQPKLIRWLDQYVTHASIIIRNPYVWMDSFYNFSQQRGKYPKNLSSTDIFNLCIRQKYFNYAETIKKWQKNLIKNKLHVFFYDDLNNDPNKFYSHVLNLLELENRAANTKKMVVTNYISRHNYTEEQIKILNEHICQLEKLQNRDLSHWKR